MGRTFELVGNYTGWRKVSYPDRETGEVQVSERFCMDCDSLEFTDGDTVDHFMLRVPDSVTVPALKRYSPVCVTLGVRQSADGKNWFVDVVSIEEC